MRTVAQLLLMCDRSDLGVSVNAEADPVGRGAARTPGAGPRVALEEPRIFIYDNYPGGIGFSAPLFDDAGSPARGQRRSDRQLRVRARLSVVRRADRRDRAARQARRARPARAADRPRRRCRRRRRRPSTTARCRSSVRDAGSPARAREGHRPGASDRGFGAASGVRELTYEPVGDDGLPLIDAPLSASLAGATEIDGPLGKTLVVERHYAPADWHGSLQLRDARVTPDDVALIARDPAAADAPRARILYLDLETTGLSGGAGTVAFLVGCALSREDGSFLIRQFVLPELRRRAGADRRGQRMGAGRGGGPGHLQRPDLRRAGDGDAVGVPPPALAVGRPAAPRHAARRAAAVVEEARPRARAAHRGTRRPRPSSGCRLVQLERTLFEVERVGDVSGFEIPGRYFDFVRRGDWSVLEPVLHHNRLDLLSLAGVTARAARLLRDRRQRPARAPRKRRCSAASCTAGPSRPGPRPATAAAWTTSPAAHPLRGETLAGLARLLRSQRRYDEAAACWTEITGAARAARRPAPGGDGGPGGALRAPAPRPRARAQLRRAGAAGRHGAPGARPGAGRTGAIRLDRRLDRLRRKLSGTRPECEAVAASPGPGLF